MISAMPEKTQEERGKGEGSPGSGKRAGWLGKIKNLAAGCFVIAISVHVLILLIVGGYTLFKGSAPRMPFTSEGGVPADVPMEAPPPDSPEPEHAMESESAPAATEAPAMEADSVLAVSGMTSPAMSFTATPPTVTAPSTGAMRTEKLMGKPNTRGGAKASAVNFFGVKGEGTNVYFVVDVSDSMVEPNKGGIDGYRSLKEKLGQMISSLAAETNFNLVFYGYTVDLFRPESVPATTENKQAALQFLAPYMASNLQRGNISKNFKPKIEMLPSLGGTSRMDLGLLAAFEGRADTIFVLTDGKPVIKRAMTDKEREEYKKRSAEASIPEADRQKYAKQVEEWKKEHDSWQAEIKQYQEKYKDKLEERARKVADNQAKGKGKVVEGKGFVPEWVKIAGLPDAPKEPEAPKLPQPKKDGQAVGSADLGNWEDQQILDYLKEAIRQSYQKDGYSLPSIHGVSFLAKGSEEKFLKSLAGQNNGSFSRISSPIR